MSGLFRKKIDPRCLYCARGVSLDPNEVMCIKCGIVKPYGTCRQFRYDPLKRVPPKPVKLSRNYTAEDMKI